MRFVQEDPPTHTIDSLRHAQTVPLPTHIAESHRKLRLTTEMTGARRVLPRQLPALTQTPTRDGIYAIQPRRTRGTIDMEAWTPQLLQDHPGRGWTGEFEGMPDFARIQNVPPRAEDLLDKMLLTKVWNSVSQQGAGPLGWKHDLHD